MLYAKCSETFNSFFSVITFNDDDNDDDICKEIEIFAYYLLSGYSFHKG